MSRINTAAVADPVFTHEGGRAVPVGPMEELKRTVLTCMLWEDTFYEKGSGTAARIAELVPKCTPADVEALASEARDNMQLRHAPLFLIRELARVKGAGANVERSLSHIIQRADELSEFLLDYIREIEQ